MHSVSEQISTKPKTQRRRFLKLIGLVLAFVVTAIISWIAAHSRLVDYQVYYYSGKSLLSGNTDLYAPGFSLGLLMDYRYPPLFLLIVCPLSLFSLTVASFAWLELCLLQVVGCVYFVGRSIADAGTIVKEKLVWLIVFGAVGQYFLMALHYGNVQIFVTFAIFGSFYLAARSKTVLYAAFLMAVAITFKVFGVLVLPYFLLKRQWKYLITVGIFVVVLNLIPALYFGFAKNTELLETWFDHVILNQENHETIGPVNLSLKGQLARYLTDIDYSQRIVGTTSFDTEYQKVNLLSISAEYSKGIWIFISLILYIGFLFVARKRTGVTGPYDTSSLEFSLIICMTLLVNPLTPKIYFILLLLPVAALAQFAFSVQTFQAKICRYILGFVAAANVILPLIPGREAQRLFLVIGVDFWITAIMTASLFYVLTARTAEESSLVQAPVNTSVDGVLAQT